jgi:putative spermidine/putrescine transport system ATP-binding protein
MASLTLVNLVKRFSTGLVAVNDVSIEVQDGEFVCFLGPSGCGKSTALRMISGFETPTSGDILIDGRSVVEIPPNRRPTAMVFQKYTLWPHMTVYDNIAFGLRLRRLSKVEINRKVREALVLVGLANYGDRMPSQLSGGEQQRVALARAIVLEPKILLLDEPFSNLDALLRVRLREELHKIQRQTKITAIFVTHDQEEALSLADRIAVMSRGQIEQVDKPSNIYANPQTLFVADFIGVMNLLPGSQSGAAIKVGDQTLAAPANQDYNGPVTVAIRPEDMALLSTTSSHETIWRGQVEQMMDLGHYRKVLVKILGVGMAKVYLSKSVSADEGETLSLYPTRYMVFRDGQPPVEVKRQVVEGALTFNA